ncbi:MAG: efflux RND transporter periplasmic adaptor subunit [Acidobacteriota bacterium]
MKKVLILTGVLAAIVALVVVSVTQARRHGTKVYEEEAKRVDELVSTVKASGEIQPRVFVNVSSQVPGEIVGLRVQEGDHVKKGDILVQLDPKQYRSNVDRLEANLRIARINLDREKTALATYKHALDRQLRLASAEIVSRENLENAQLQYDTSRIQVRALEEQILQAQADLAKARDELAKTTIRAPMDGLVTRVNAKLGEQVIIGTMNNPGTSILVLSDMSELLAEVKVDETEVTQVTPGDKATVTVDAIENHDFDGVVTEIAHTALKERDVSRFVVKVSLRETPGGQMEARRELPLPAGAKIGPTLASLRPGMSAHAAIEVASKAHALVVPIQAVIERKRGDVETALEESAGKESETSGTLAAEADDTASAGGVPPGVRDEDVEILFVDRDGRAEMMPVKTGLSDEFNVEILDAALQPGDHVVVGPYRTLKKLKHGERLVRVEKDEELEEKG